MIFVPELRFSGTTSSMRRSIVGTIAMVYGRFFSISFTAASGEKRRCMIMVLRSARAS